MEMLKLNTEEISLEAAFIKYYPYKITCTDALRAFRAEFCAGKRCLCISNPIGLSSYMIVKRGRKYYISTLKPAAT